MEQQYLELLSALVKGFGALIGVGASSRKASGIGITVDETGNVTAYSGEPLKKTQELLDQYIALSGNVALNFCKKAVTPIREKYANIKIPPSLM